MTAMVEGLTDLIAISGGRPVLPPEVHHMSNLLELEPEQVLEAFRLSQVGDFSGVIAGLDRPGSPLYDLFADLRDLGGQGNPFAGIALFRPGALQALFLDLHDHVMSHPVWRHPFFLRFFRGEFSHDQLVAFARHYFNQVKNTRQCVALAVGRFNGLMDLPYGPLNERVSELTQIVLAQLVADEYGVGAHDIEAYPSLARLFSARTHIVMYRQMFEGLGLPFAEQDVPLLWGVADNVLTQRLVAGHPAFTPLEALASVGLGMEWGVPEFFSLLLGGMLRYGWCNNVPLTQRHLEVLTAHVKYDVLHAVSVMLVTALHMRGEGDVAVVKNAVNSLMAARYGMMSDLYRHVFGEILPPVALDARHCLTDRRIETALREARRTIAPQAVTDGEGYRERDETPFLFV